MSEKQRFSRKAVCSVEEWINRQSTEQESEERFSLYRRYLFIKVLFILVCVAVMVAVFGYSITTGASNIGFFETYQIMWDHLTDNVQDDLLDYIVIELRTPRVIVAVIAGAGLAICGVIMQSTLLNPLADPYTTGLSSGASFGATIAIVGNISLLSGNYFIVGNAFVFSLIPTGIILLVSKLKNSSPTTMIMAGIAVMYIFNAITTVLMLWADPNAMQAVYIWQVGTLSKANWENIPIMTAVVLAGIIISLIMSKKFNILATGDESASALGVNANRIRIFNLLLVSLVTATVVSFTGLIGFIGLVAPHIARIFVGPDNKYLIIASAVFGGMLLMVADLIGRTALSPTVLQAGVIMSFIGGPMFLWLIINKKSNIWG